MIRVEGRIFFANAEQIQHKIKLLVDEAQPKIVALHLRSVPDLEFTALKMLIEAEERNRERGIRLWLVGANPEVLDMIRRSPLVERLGPYAMHFNLEIAVDKFVEGSSSTQMRL
jgi:anti-anti-sigma factor